MSFSIYHLKAYPDKINKNYLSIISKESLQNVGCFREGLLKCSIWGCLLLYSSLSALLSGEIPLLVPRRTFQKNCLSAGISKKPLGGVCGFGPLGRSLHLTLPGRWLCKATLTPNLPPNVRDPDLGGWDPGTYTLLTRFPR